MQQEVRGVWNNAPCLVAGQIVEQAAYTGEPHKFVAGADHGQHRDLDAACGLNGGEREFSHARQHVGPNLPHHQRISDESDGGGRR